MTEDTRRQYDNLLMAFADTLAVRRNECEMLKWENGKLKKANDELKAELETLRPSMAPEPDKDKPEWDRP